MTKKASTLSDDEDLNREIVPRLHINSGIWNKFKGISHFESRAAKKTIEEILSKFIEEWESKNLKTTPMK